ncbi:hypothetical protein [Streptomyces sp. NPDC048606]|uniref:hypothetical protein n=1 Tax=Streptomyces sp. NPDC048606 TaxID=3154726 RepID=UPI00344A876C
MAAEFTGTGHQSTGDFTTSAGLTLVTASCPACRLAFTVTVLDSEGRAEDLPVTAFGPYEGTRAATLPPGTHYLKVDADSAWTVRLGPPPGGAPADLPQAYAGRGDRLEGPFTATGTLRLEGSHTGAGHFIVRVLDADGGLVDLPFNTAGEHRSTATSRLHGPGPYYLDVTALGAWTLRLAGE